MQPNISHSGALYLDSVLVNLFEKNSTGYETLLCCCLKTALIALPDASDLTHTSNSRSYTLTTRANVKDNFNASKAAYYSASNLNNFLPCKLLVRGILTLVNP